MTEPKPYTVVDCYGKPFAELKAPQGYEFTGEFREPRGRNDENGDTWLPQGVAKHSMVLRGAFDAPRLILRPAPKRKRVVFEEVRRVTRGQWINPGEWFSGIANAGRFYEASDAGTTACGNLIIYSRREEEF